MESLSARLEPNECADDQRARPFVARNCTSEWVAMIRQARRRDDTRSVFAALGTSWLH
jgi:hypothetical protein